ncbi:GM11855 [Drosophila sechellia]|uniref:GM11855 n=1 Tax=Drosophila sechellia TaxID=7238 RepID=B4IHF1_DROSE|nr:GM11855 [Drosophila sechellia]
MGCSSSKTSATVEDTKSSKPCSAKSSTTRMAAKKEYPASEAFTIPLESDDSPEMPLNETVRQPPKRIQQLLQEAASSEPLTLEELEEKQLKAEQRRQELMQQKLEILHKNAQMLMKPHGETAGEGEGEGEGEGDRNKVEEEQPEKV